MTASTPAAEYYHLRETLDWAATLLAHQPQTVEQSYQQAAEHIADALITPTFSVAIQLPGTVVMDTTVHYLSDHSQRLQAGNILNRVRHISCAQAVLHTLEQRAALPDPAVSASTRLLRYMAAQHILTRRIPPVESIQSDYVAFDNEGHYIARSLDAADKLVDQLAQYVDWLHIAEQLYPGVSASDDYDAIRTTLIEQITAQGRALATCYTTQIATDLKAQWKAGKLARGLTLYVPYLDERAYRMTEYKIVVIPNARIPFRPQFVVSACRVAEREVRQHPNLTQSTRWQLISQLDQLSQAFDVKPVGESPEQATS
ncbi:MAG: hypothetical protein IT324_07140 [Anaerolineae bacterium]|nr:hypothetical protein [Anaerolineae bacterium]